MLLVRDLLDFGQVETGWLFVYIGICSIIIQAGLIGRLVKGLGEMPVAIIGGVISCFLLGLFFVIMRRKAGSDT